MPLRPKSRKPTMHLPRNTTLTQIKMQRPKTNSLMPKRRTSYYRTLRRRKPGINMVLPLLIKALDSTLMEAVLEDRLAVRLAEVDSRVLAGALEEDLRRTSTSKTSLALSLEVGGEAEAPGNLHFKRKSSWGKTLMYRQISHSWTLPKELVRIYSSHLWCSARLALAEG